MDSCSEALKKVKACCGLNCECKEMNLLQALVDKPTFTKDDLYEIKRIIEIADTYFLVNHIVAEQLLEKIEEMEEGYDQ